MSSAARRLLWFGKAVVFVYWAWLWKVALWPSGSDFEGLLAMTGPLVVAAHALQLLLVTRRLPPRGPFLREAALILVFGAFRVAELTLGSRAEVARSGR